MLQRMDRLCRKYKCG